MYLFTISLSVSGTREKTKINPPVRIPDPGFLRLNPSSAQLRIRLLSWPIYPQACNKWVESRSYLFRIRLCHYLFRIRIQIRVQPRIPLDPDPASDPNPDPDPIFIIYV